MIKLLKILKNHVTDFDSTENGMVVNRLDNIAYLGGAALDNEECHLIQKLFRAGLGLSFIEHQARI